MSKRMTESQIVAILKEAEAGMPVKISAVSTVSAIQRFINGAKNTVAWKRLMCAA